MLRKLSMLVGVFLVAGAVIWSFWPAPVSAQCGVNLLDSSCFKCHTAESEYFGKGEWHSIHAPKDCCANCHGGNCAATDKELAHQGMIPNPLEDIYTNCHACHPYDYQERAARFAATLNITPASRETPTPYPLPPVEPPKPGFIMPTDLLTAPTALHPLGLIIGGLALLALTFLGIGWLEKRHVAH